MHVFQPFNPKYVERLLALRKKYLVSQSYRLSEHLHPGKVPLLLSDYEEISRARTHRNAIVPTDRFAAIIHLDNEHHRAKLMDMLSPSSGYVLYFAAIKSAESLERHLNQHYRDKMRRWIDTNTTWRLTKEAGIRPSLQLIFGVLYINLKYAGHSVRIKFEDIENA